MWDGRDKTPACKILWQKFFSQIFPQRWMNSCFLLPISHWFNLSSIRDNFKAHALFSTKLYLTLWSAPNYKINTSCFYVYITASKFRLFASICILNTVLNSKVLYRLVLCLWISKVGGFFMIIYFTVMYILVRVYICWQKIITCLEKMLFCVTVLPATRNCCCCFFSLTT